MPNENELRDVMTPPTSSLEVQKTKQLLHWHTAVIYGANELATRAKTLGEKVFWRLLRDNAVAEFTRLGGTVDMTHEHAPVLVLEHAPHIRFDARDIELMRSAVAAHDAAQSEAPSKAPA